MVSLDARMAVKCNGNLVNEIILVDFRGGKVRSGIYESGQGASGETLQPLQCGGGRVCDEPEEPGAFRLLTQQSRYGREAIGVGRVVVARSRLQIRPRKVEPQRVDEQHHDFGASWRTRPVGGVHVQDEGSQSLVRGAAVVGVRGGGGVARFERAARDVVVGLALGALLPGRSGQEEAAPEE